MMAARSGAHTRPRSRSDDACARRHGAANRKPRRGLPSPCCPPFPLAEHPAFAWLRQPVAPGQGIVDLDAWRPDRLYLPNRGPVATHTWAGCESWAAEIALPASQITVGWNELTLRSAYGARPVDLTGGKNSDTRWLSVGVTKLEVAPILDPSAD